MKRRWLALVLIAASATGGAELVADRFVSSRWGISLSPPRSWQLSEQGSYPTILLWMSRRNPDGKMLLSAEKADVAEGALEYARKTRNVLHNIGFTVRAPQVHTASGGYMIDFDDGSNYLRQAYVVKDDRAFTLTLAAPSIRLRSQHLRAFDDVLRSIRFQEPDLVEEDPAL